MLQKGTLLGPYEILAQIGAGGMGEVYKARDTPPKVDLLHFFDELRRKVPLGK